MEEFRVPQHELEVELALEGGFELKGHMFVPVVGAASQPVPLAERLNGNERFLPFSRDGEFEMLNKSRLRWVRHRGPVALEPSVDATRERRLCVEMAEGQLVEGHVRYLMPQERSRLLDFLNFAPRFLELADDNVQTLVNLEFVVRVQALSPDPA